MKLLRTFSLIALMVLMAGASLRADTLDDARKAHGAGQLDTAITLYQTVVQKGPPSEARAAQFAIAACLFAEQKDDDAYNAFLAFSKQYRAGSDSILALIQAGNVRVEQGRPDDAKPLFDQALSNDQGAPDSNLWVSWANLGEGRVLTADKNYQAAVPYLLKAIAGASEQRVIDIAKQCMQACDTGLRDAGQTTYAQQWLGESELDEGRWLVNHEEFAQAQAPLNAACTNLTAPGTLGEAQTLLATTDYQSCHDAASWTVCLGAASTAQQTLEQDPDAGQIYASLLGKDYAYQAWALYFLQQFQESIDKCEAMRTNVHSPDPGQLVDSYMCEAAGLYDTKQYSAEISFLSNFRASYTDGAWRAQAGLKIATAYYAENDYTDAISSLKQFISDANAQPCNQQDKDGLRYFLAKLLAQTGDTSGAKALFTAIASDSTQRYPALAKTWLAQNQ